nr:LOB domain-containing protein 22-like [Tanacetum cinerariifolium]
MVENEMSFEESIGRLTAYEERIKSQDTLEANDQDKLLMESSNNKSYGKWRDKNSNKWKNNPNTCKASTSQGTKDKSKPMYYECGEHGHFAKECKKWKNKQEESHLIYDTEPIFLEDKSRCSRVVLHNRRCPLGYILAPYFPHAQKDTQIQVQNVHCLIGFHKMRKMLTNIDDERDDAMTSLMYKADARGRDPIGGCHRIVCTLQGKYASARRELEFVTRLNALCKGVYGYAEQKQDQGFDLDINVK